MKKSEAQILKEINTPGCVGVLGIIANNSTPRRLKPIVKLLRRKNVKRS